MRGSKVKRIRSAARVISEAEQFPIRSYKLTKEQTKIFVHPLIEKPIEYNTATIILDQCQRSVYKQLKTNVKSKYN